MDALLRSHADQIIKASITAVLPDEAVKRALVGLTFSGRVVLVAAGKAAWQMAKAAYDVLGDRIENGVVVTKYDHVKAPIANLDCREAGHPVPDENSFSGTQAALDLVKNWPEGTWKAVLGPWKHSGNADYDIHGLYVGEDALRYDMDLTCMKWLEHFLKGVDNGIEKTSTVEYYSIGEMKWKEAQVWPPESVKKEIWYFEGKEDDDAAGNGIKCGEGSLTVSLMSNGNQKDTYLYDPANPAHHIIDMAENEIEVPENYTEEEKRSDILTFSSPVLTEPITVTGDMIVKLYISCDQPDTDFIVRLTDVDETGKSMKLADGVRGAKYRNGFEKPEYLVPGEVYEVNIRTTKLSHCFLPGHRIRVTVTSSAKNFIFPNSNTEKGFNSEEIRCANVTVHRNRRYPSCIILPVENGIEMEFISGSM